LGIWLLEILKKESCWHWSFPTFSFLAFSVFMAISICLRESFCKYNLLFVVIARGLFFGQGNLQTLLCDFSAGILARLSCKPSSFGKFVLLAVQAKFFTFWFSFRANFFGIGFYSAPAVFRVGFCFSSSFHVLPELVKSVYYSSRSCG
jgi:hypothetical protein